jgi:hypothetical protein
MAFGTSPGSSSDCTGKTAGLLSVDANVAPSSANAVAVPLLVTDPDNYSFESWLRLVLTSAPDNSVTSLKVWGPNTRPNGDAEVTDYIGTIATYATPSDSGSSVATDRVDTVRYSVGTALPIAGTLESVNDASNFIVMQRKVGFGAGKGTLPNQIFNYQYIES